MPAMIKATSAIQPPFHSSKVIETIQLANSCQLNTDSLLETNKILQDKVDALTVMLSQAQLSYNNEIAARTLSDARLKELLDVLPAGVVILDVKGRISKCNPAAEELLGEPLNEELWLDIIKRNFSPKLDDGHEISLKDGRRVNLVTRSLDAEPGQLIVLMDMTETRALQERLSRHQRLSAMGKMMASLAHQIRTPLTAAMLYGEHVANPDLDPTTQQRFAVKLNSRLNNVEQQIRDMLIFAKGNMPLSDFINSQQLVTSLHIGMEALLNNTNTLCSIINDAPNIMLHCNQDALAGAILNLVNNSIESANAAIRIKIHLQQQNDFLIIKVIDNGPGIDEALQEKIMEPFFTTKSHGTGLGMSVVQAVIKAHQGEFSILSNTENGTEVTLKLPLLV